MKPQNDDLELVLDVIGYGLQCAIVEGLQRELPHLTAEAQAKAHVILYRIKDGGTFPANHYYPTTERRPLP